MAKNKKYRYASVCVDGDFLVLSADTIEDYRRLDNGHMFTSKGNVYYTPFFFPSDDMTLARDFLYDMEKDSPKKTNGKVLCPDKL